MEKPKITTIAYIEFNGELFKEGDIVEFEMGEFFKKTGKGRIAKISTITNMIDIDCSQEYESKIESYNICNYESIRHAEE